MDTDQNNNTELQDLEKAFEKEALSVPTTEPAKPEPVVEANGFAKTKQSLTDTDNKLAEKITKLKADAKAELENLKNLKNSIAKKIADVKELEETREKIKKELEKLSGLESEVHSITEEAKNELGEQ